MFKNVASQKLIVFAFDSTTNLPKTGDAANLTAYVSKDYGTVTVLADTSATEMDATNAKGYYLFDLAQAETNADTLLFSAKSSTSNVVVVGVPATVFTAPTTGFLAPATAGRTLVVDAAGLADANAVKVGPTGSGTALTARDLGASVLLSAGTGTGQLDFTSGVVKANVTQWLGTAASTPTVAGVPNVNVKTWNDLATVALPLVPTVAGRTLDVSAGGEAGLDWANVGSPTTSLALTGTTIATTQKVDVETIKTNPVVNAGTVTFPTGATLASTTNITAGTITTTTSVTNRVTANADQFGGQTVTAAAAVTVNANVGTTQPVNFTGTGVNAKAKADVTGWLGATPITPVVAGAPAVDVVYYRGGNNPPALVNGFFEVHVSETADGAITAASFAAGAVDSTAAPNLDAAVGTRAPAATALSSATWTGAKAAFLTGDAFARLGPPAGASVSADVAAVAAKTTNLPASPAAVGDVPTVAQIWTTALTEAYRSAGAAGTAAQLLHEILQNLTEFAVSGTTKTVKKFDGSATAKTYTINDATTPTAITETT